MSMVILAMMASAQVMPWLDRASLDRHARLEASTREPMRAGRSQVASARAAKALLTRDVQAVVTVCKAAGNFPQSKTFLEALGKGYLMTSAEIGDLKRACAIFAAGARKTG